MSSHQGSQLKNLNVYTIKTRYSKVWMVRVSKPHDTVNQSQAALGVRLVASGQRNRSEKIDFCHSYECSNSGNYRWLKKGDKRKCLSLYEGVGFLKPVEYKS